MPVFLLFVLLWISTAKVYNFTDLNISVVTYSSSNLISGNTCNKLIVRNQQVYHLSNQGVWQSWLKGSLSNQTAILTFNALTSKVIDYDVSQNQTFVLFYAQSLLGLTNNNTIYSIDSQYSINKVIQQSQAAIPVSTFITDTYIYEFYGANTTGPQKIIQKRNKTTNSIISKIPGTNTYKTMAVSPNYQVGVTWTSNTQCIFYDLTSLSQIGTYSPVSYPTSATNMITFSQDSNYAVIETDNYNPVVVLSISSLSVFQSVYVNDVISNAYFLDNLNQILVISGQNAVVFFNLTSNKSYSTPPIQATLFVVDQDYNIFTCYNGTITQMSVTVGEFGSNFTLNAAVNSTNSTINTTNSSHSSNTSTPANVSSNTSNPVNASNLSNASNQGYFPNQNNNSQQQPQNYNYPQKTDNTSNKAESNTTNRESTKHFYKIILLDAVQQAIVSSINKTLQTTTVVVNVLASVASSTPLTIYFLGFLNYISITSLYILLNFQIPEQIYQYLVLLSNNINTDILCMLGLNLKVPVLSDQKITQARPLYFGISSDIFQGNIQNIAVFLVSVFVILAFLFFIIHFCSKDNAFRQLFVREKKNMIYGQLIGLIQPFVLPWSSILLNGGVKNIQTKLNSTSYSIIFCFFSLFPFYYLLELIKQSKVSSKPGLVKQIKAPTFRLKWVNNRLSFSQDLRTEIKQMQLLFSPKLIEEWLLCFTNFIFPLLVLLDSPVIFLVVILFYDLFGVFIASKRKAKRINGILLSLYPLLFHICFMLFYWCPSDSVIAVTEVFCFLVLLTGIIHNILTMVVQIIAKSLWLVRRFLWKNKIKPINRQATIKTKIKRKQSKAITKKKRMYFGNKQASVIGPGAQKKEMKRVQFMLDRLQLHDCHGYLRNSRTDANKDTQKGQQSDKAKKKTTKDKKHFDYLVISKLK